jgi:hypothetical protein
MRDRVPDAHENEVLGPPEMERKRRRPSSKKVVAAHRRPIGLGGADDAVCFLRPAALPSETAAQKQLGRRNFTKLYNLTI